MFDRGVLDGQVVPSGAGNRADPGSSAVRNDGDGEAWIDVSVALGPATPCYEGDPVFRMEPVSRWIATEPKSYSLSRIEMGTHSGTHLDAPAHFGGALGVDAAPVSLLMGPALLLDLSADSDRISGTALARFDLRGVTRLLIKTVAQPNGRDGTSSDGVGRAGGPGSAGSGSSAAFLTEDAARYLRGETDVRLVGIDALSVESGQGSGFPVHHILLREEPPIWILETLDLRLAVGGWYDLVALPLKISGADASPARALLRYRIWHGP